MYTLLRKIHLYTGLTLLVMVLMYFVTGYLMIHYKWFPDPAPRKQTRTVAVPQAEGKDPAAYAIQIQEQFGLRGRRVRPQQRKDGGWTFLYYRPGEEFEVAVSAGGKTAEITHQEQGTVGMLVGFHRLHRYGGGWQYSVWAFLYDLASLAMIVFPLTGIYMWYKLTQKRLLGWILLGFSLAYSAGNMLYLVYAP